MPKVPSNDDLNISRLPVAGRIVTLDIGTKWIGVAVCDPSQIIARPVSVLRRSSWKTFLAAVNDILAEFDAVALVLGLPYNFDGSESEMSREARRLALNFSKSIQVPVFLQDERVSTYEAKGRLWLMGYDTTKAERLKDSEAASIILSDFLERLSSARKDST
ncbi:MAG: Holliday junction resolvase RuvX [Pyrinomonadaceae bacterium]